MGISLILQQLHHSEFLPLDEAQKILPPRLLTILKKDKILSETDTLALIPCLECNSCFSKVEITRQGVRAYCESNNDFYDLPESYSLPCLKFETNNFLSKTKREFEIRGSQEKISPEIWYLGYTQNTPHIHIFFSFEKHIQTYTSDVVRILGSNDKAFFFVPFPSSEFTIPIEIVNRTKVITFDNIVSIQSQSLKWDREEFEHLAQNSFRDIEFTLDGRLLYKGTVLRDYQQGSNEYIFLQSLWEKYDRAVSYDEIFEKQKKGKPSSKWKNATSFCETTKSRICNKDSESKETVEKIILPANASGSKKGYRMTSPSQ